MLLLGCGTRRNYGVQKTGINKIVRKRISWAHGFVWCVHEIFCKIFMGEYQRGDRLWGSM